MNHFCHASFYRAENGNLHLPSLFLKNVFVLILLTCSFQGFAINPDILIEQKTRSLIAPEGESYQWYYNDEPVTGGNARNLKVKESGFYSVIITDKDGKQNRVRTAIAVTAATIIKVYLIGDSTVSNYNSGYYPQTGWGQVLRYFFNSSEVTIDNRAVGGTSSRSFYNLYWSGIRSSLLPGDYVFIGFGINDSNKSDPSRYTEPNTTFKEFLTRYVNETKSRGAIPVLVSTVCRNAWNSTNPPTVYPAYHGYPVATRELAASLGVPLIDLDRLSIGLLESVGPSYSGPYLYMNLAAGEYPNYSGGRTDHVHFQESGAIEMARLATQGLRDHNSPLVASLAPTYPVNVSTNNTNAGLITRTQNFPAGVNVTLKVIPKSGYTFLRWVDGAGTTVSTSRRFTFTMGSSTRNYTAIYSTASTPSITFQENATGFCSVDGTVDSNYSGYTGSGFSNTTNVTGAGIRWRVSSTASGTYTLLFRHANGGTAARPARLLINGATAISSINFPTTGSFSSWADVSVNVTLPAGTSDIRLEGTTADALSNIDYMKVTGTSPSAASCSTTTTSITVEENTTGFCGVDGTVDNNHTGFSGTGFANTNNVTGAGITWRLSTPASGTYTLSFRHANGGTARDARLLINGATSISSITFPTTGSFTSWADVTVNVTLPAGNSDLRLEGTTANALSNIDNLTVTGNSPSAVLCHTASARSITSSETLVGNEEDAVSVYPNPSNEIFTIKSKGGFKYVVTDLSGRVIEKGQAKNTTQIRNSLTPGTYVISIEHEEGVKKIKVLKK